MDDAVGALNIHGVVRVRSEGLLADDGIVDEVLPHGVTVVERDASEGGEGGRGHIGRADLARDDVELEHIGGDGSTHGLEGLKRGVGGGEDGEGTGSGELGGDTSGLKKLGELAEVL
eukprot:109470_1